MGVHFGIGIDLITMEYVLWLTSTHRPKSYLTKSNHLCMRPHVEQSNKPMLMLMMIWHKEHFRHFFIHLCVRAKLWSTKNQKANVQHSIIIVVCSPVCMLPVLYWPFHSDFFFVQDFRSRTEIPFVWKLF